jgi:fibronectin-binding autotransporter adhesin
VAACRLRSSPAIYARYLSFRRFLACLFCLLIARPDHAFAVDKTWTGASSTTWNVNGNWSGNAPSSGDNAVFNSTFSNQPNVNGNSVGGIWFTGSIGQNTTFANGGTLIISGNTINGTAGLGILVDNANAFALTINAAIQLSGAQTWRNNSANLLTIGSGGINLNNKAFTIDGSGNTTVTGVMSGGGAFTKTGTGTLTLSGTNTYTGGTTVNGGTVILNSASSFGATAGGVALNAATVEVATGFSTSRIYTVGSSSSTFQVDPSQTLTVTGAIAGIGTLNKTGTGTMVLNASNTYTGGTVVSAGTLQLAANDRLANSGTVTISGGTFDLQTFTDTVGLVTLSSGSITGTGTGALTGSSFTLQSGSVSAILAGAGALTKSGSGTVTLSGVNTYSGGTSINGGILAVTSSGSLGSSGTISFNGGTLQFSVGNTTDYSSRLSSALNQAYSFDTNSQNVVLVNALTSSGGTLTKLGSGTLTIGNNDTNANTFTGLTTVSAGELDLNKQAGTNAIAGDGNTSTADLTVAGGTLKWLASNQIANSATVTMSSGTVNLNGFNETLYAFTNSGGTFMTGTGHLIGTGATTTWSGGTNTVNDGGVVEDGHIVITGGTNTVQGGTTGGILQLDSGGTGLEMTGSTLTLNSDNGVAGRLVLLGDVTSHASGTTSQIVSGLSNTNAGAIDLSGGTRTFTVEDGAAATDLAVGAVIKNGSLIKAGAGVMALNGANTLSGTVTVNAGTLTLAASSGSALGSVSTITVNSGGTLQLGASNQINDSATMTLNGGTLNTGGLSEHVGALTLQSTSTIDMSSGASIIAFADSHSLSWTGTLNIYNWTGTPNTGGGTDELFFGTGSTGLTASQLLDMQFYSGNGTGAYAAGALILANGEVVPIPEVGTFIPGLLAVFVLLARSPVFSRNLAKLKKRKPPVA